MPYRRHSNLKAGQFSRTSITGAGNVIKRAPIGGGGGGENPEPPVFTISVGTGEAGSEAEAYITGSHPNWHIELIIPRGDKGDKGDEGNPGPPGVCDCDCCDDNDCPSDMTFIRAVSTDDIYYDAGCGPMTIGYHIVNIVADGNCGEKEDAFDQWNVGDVGTCNGYIYSVDSNGNVTSRYEGDGGGGGGITCPDGYHDDGFGNCVPNDPV